MESNTTPCRKRGWASVEEFIEMINSMSCNSVQPCIQCGGCCEEPCGFGQMENGRCTYLTEDNLCRKVLEDTTGHVKSILGIGKGCVGRYYRKETKDG